VDHKPVGITAAVKIDLIPKRGNFQISFDEQTIIIKASDRFGG